DGTQLRTHGSGAATAFDRDTDEQIVETPGIESRHRRFRSLAQRVTLYRHRCDAGIVPVRHARESGNAPGARSLHHFSMGSQHTKGSFICRPYTCAAWDVTGEADG